MIVKHFLPDLVQPISRLPEEGNLARKAFSLQELGDPPRILQLTTKLLKSDETRGQLTSWR